MPPTVVAICSLSFLLTAVVYYQLLPPQNCDLGDISRRSFNLWYGIQGSNTFNLQKGEDVFDCSTVYWGGYPDSIQRSDSAGWVVVADRGGGKSVLQKCRPMNNQHSWVHLQFSTIRAESAFSNFFLATQSLALSEGSNPIAQYWKVDDFSDELLVMAIEQYLNLWISDFNLAASPALRLLSQDEKMALSYIVCSRGPIGNVEALLLFLKWLWTTTPGATGYFGASEDVVPEFRPSSDYTDSIRSQVRRSFNDVRVLQTNRKETENILLNVMFDAPGEKDFSQVELFHARFLFLKQRLVTARAREGAGGKCLCDREAATELDCVDPVEALRIFVQIIKRVYKMVFSVAIDGLDENSFLFQGADFIVPNLLTFIKSALDRNIISIFLAGDLKIYYLLPNFIANKSTTNGKKVSMVEYFSEHERYRFDKLPLHYLNWSFDRLTNYADFSLDYIRRVNSGNDRCMPLPSIHTLLGLDNPEHVALLSTLRHPRDFNSFMQEMMMRLQDIAGTSHYCSGHGPGCVLWNLKHRYGEHGKRGSDENGAFPFIATTSDIKYCLERMKIRSV
jgi:hypothetical protein